MLQVEHLAKSFGTDRGAVRAIDDVSFEVPQGKVLTLLGPSGCGKTTTLRSIAGLEWPDEGRISVTGKDLFNAAKGTAVPGNRRNIGMVFQSYAIWPQMDVFGNVAFPLKVRPRRERLSHEEITREVARVLEIVRLEGLEKREATKLSGGQQQRLALARALIRQPEILLLDEPLSNLDAKLREHMRFELSALQKRLDLTMIYVTHDQEEALALSDTVAVMNNGRIVQIGSGQDIYERPQNRFVADFVGTTNFLSGKITGKSGDGYAVATSQGLLSCVSAVPLGDGQAVDVSIRPENITFVTDSAPQQSNTIKAQVEASIFLGQTRHHLLKAGTDTIRAIAFTSRPLDLGSSVLVAAAPGHCVAVPAEPRSGRVIDHV